MFSTASYLRCPDIELDDLRIDETAFTLVATSTRHAAVCPQCQSMNARVHAATLQPSPNFPASDDVSSSCFASDASLVILHHVTNKSSLSVLVPPSPGYSTNYRLRDALRRCAFAADGEGALALPMCSPAVGTCNLA